MSLIPFFAIRRCLLAVAWFLIIFPLSLICESIQTDKFALPTKLTIFEVTIVRSFLRDLKLTFTSEAIRDEFTRENPSVRICIDSTPYCFSWFPGLAVVLAPVSMIYCALTMPFIVLEMALKSLSRGHRDGAFSFPLIILPLSNVCFFIRPGLSALTFSLSINPLTIIFNASLPLKWVLSVLRWLSAYISWAFFTLFINFILFFGIKYLPPLLIKRVFIDESGLIGLIDADITYHKRIKRHILHLRLRVTKL